MQLPTINTRACLSYDEPCKTFNHNFYFSDRVIYNRYFGNLIPQAPLLVMGCIPQ